MKKLLIKLNVMDNYSLIGILVSIIKLKDFLKIVKMEGRSSERAINVLEQRATNIK